MSVRTVIFNFTGAKTSLPDPIVITLPFDTLGRGNINTRLLPYDKRSYDDGTILTMTAPLNLSDGGFFMEWNISTVVAATVTTTVNANRTAVITISGNTSVTAVYKQVDGALSAYLTQVPQNHSVSKSSSGDVSSLSLTDNNFSIGSLTPSVTGSGSYSYLWNDGTTSSSLNTTEGSLSYVTILDNATAETVVLYGGATFVEAVLILISGSQPKCADGSGGILSALVMGENLPASYLWDTAETTPSISFVYPVGIFTKSVQITDLETGIDVTLDIGAIGKSAITLSLTGIDNTDLLNPNGVVTASVSGGATPYSYLWDTGEESSSLTNLYGGIYSVTVTDANGCSKSGSIVLEQPSADTVGVYTYEQIQEEARKIKCCYADVAAKIVEDMESGDEVCECDGIKLMYLTKVYGIVKDFIPTGTLIAAEVGSVATINVPFTKIISNAEILVDGVVIYTVPGVFDNTDDLIAYIASNLSGNYTATANSGVLTITSVHNKSGKTVVLHYFDESKEELRPGTFTGGADNKYQGVNCLSDKEIGSIIENAHDICGCRCK